MFAGDTLMEVPYIVDGDIEDFSKVFIRWYRNGLPELSYTNQSTIPLDDTNNGDSWRADFWVSDGLNYSIVYTEDIFTKTLSIEYIFDLECQVDPYNLRTDQFYVEDENLSIKFYFTYEEDVFNAQIFWFNDMGNDSWIDKRPRLGKSLLALNRDVADKQAWNEIVG